MPERTLAHTQVLCNSTQHLVSKENILHKGAGDSSDNGVFASHISPRKQELLIQFVGNKNAYLNVI